jgi:hypothetical protein
LARDFCVADEELSIVLAILSPFGWNTIVASPKKICERTFE